MEASARTISKITQLEADAIEILAQKEDINEDTFDTMRLEVLTFMTDQDVKLSYIQIKARLNCLHCMIFLPLVPEVDLRVFTIYRHCSPRGWIIHSSPRPKKPSTCQQRSRCTWPTAKGKRW